MKKILYVAFAVAMLTACKDNKSIAPDTAPETPSDSLTTDSVSVAQVVTPEETDAAEVKPAMKEIEVKAPKNETLKVEYASFGSKLTATNALTKEQMLQKYAAMKKGDTINVKFKSRINDVCKKKGCWMSMDLADKKDAFVRFKDYEFFVPLNADNSEAIVSGKAFLDVVSVDELRHYAKDGGKSQEEIDKITSPKVTYAFTADGVLIQK